jgi:cobalamin biosynthesis protein CobD/CbiB
MEMQSYQIEVDMARGVGEIRRDKRRRTEPNKEAPEVAVAMLLGVYVRYGAMHGLIEDRPNQRQTLWAFPTLSERP